MGDIVLDTNVLVHGNNPEVEFCTASRNLVKKILECETKICVDAGFDPDESKNRSMIGHEYHTHVRFGSFAYGFLLTIINSKRLVVITRTVDRRIGNLIRQRVRKPADRVFLCVAANSRERVLVSHDFVDFSQAKRDSFRQELGVMIITAVSVMDQIA